MQLQHLAREQEQLTQALANGELTQIEHDEKMADLKQQSVDLERNITMNGIQAGFQAMAAGSKKVQKLMAAAAIVQAVIKGKEAAVAAWSAGMSVGGPFAPVVAAAYTAASLANTASIIKTISNGSKSQGSSGGGGGVPSAASSGGQAQQQQAAPQEQTRRSIDVNFTVSGVMSMDAVRELMGQINEALGDGAELNVPGV